MSKNSLENLDLTQGPIGHALLRMTIPMFFSLLAMSGFSFVDTYFISKLGDNPLKAMSFIFPVINIFMNLIIGFRVGASTLTAQYFGRKDTEQVKVLIRDALLFCLGVMLLLLIPSFLTLETVFSKMGANSEQITLIKSYMYLWYASLPFFIFTMVANGIIRSSGDARTPMLLSYSSFALNIIFDPLLIFGVGPFPGFGFAGAAMATFIARVLIAFLVLYILFFKKKLFCIQKWKLREALSSWKKISKITFPVSLTGILSPLGMTLIIKWVSRFNSDAVAGIGIASRIEFFVLLPIIALTASLSPVVGQNVGAKNFSNINKAFSYSIYFSFLWSLGMSAILFFIAPFVVSIFEATPEVQTYAIDYLRIVPCSFCGLGIFYLVNATFNAVNAPYKAMFLAFLRMGLLIVVTYFLKQIYGIMGVFSSLSISFILIGIASYGWFSSFKNQLRKLCKL